MDNQANRASSEANVFITFKLYCMYLNGDISAHSLISYVAAQARAMLLLLLAMKITRANPSMDWRELEGADAKIVMVPKRRLLVSFPWPITSFSGTNFIIGEESQEEGINAGLPTIILINIS